MPNDVYTNGTYAYKLTLGNTITQPTAQRDEVTFVLGVAKKFAEGKNTYSAMMKDITIDRRIYDPCEIVVNMDFMQLTTTEGASEQQTPPSFESISELLLKRIVTLTIVPVTQDGSGSIKEIGAGDVVAQNYYIHQLNPQLWRDVTGLGMNVRLEIYSMDKLMTLNAYSKAYVAKKLGSGILMPESRNFGKISDKDGALIQTDVSAMRFLKYMEDLYYQGEDNKKMKMASFSSEFIHPYLVQYNETFYEFLSRTANRYGEFLFFEDGKLILGLPDTGEATTINQYASVTKQEVHEGPLAVSYYARDSVKDENGEMKHLNFTAIKTGAEGFPKDTFTDGLKYNSEVAPDEYIFPLYKDKFSGWLYQKYWDSYDGFLAKPIPLVRDFISFTVGGVGQAIAPALKQIIVDEGILSGLAKMTSDSKNVEDETTYLAPLKNKTEQCDGDRVVQFSTLDEKGWTTVNYYADIHSHEQEQQKKTILIDMGTNFMPLKLGQKIRVEGLKENYVIIEIHQQSEAGGLRAMKLTAIPSYQDEKDENKEKFIPPVCPAPPVRKVGPQTAFVVDNSDPKKQGRVRVAYPWQTLNQELKTQMDEASQALKEVDDSLRLSKKKEEALKKELADLLFELQAVDDYFSVLPYSQDDDDPAHVEAMTTLQTKKEELAKEIAGLETKIAGESNDPVLEAQDTVSLNTKKSELEAVEKKIACLQKLMDHRRAIIEEIKSGRCQSPTDSSAYLTLRDHLAALQEKKDDATDKREADEQFLVRAQDRVEKAKAELDKTRKDIATPWIRVATPMATDGGGTYFKPQIGDEVLINYDSDNIERPYVVGSFFSKNLIVPEDTFTRFYNNAINKPGVSMAMVSPNGHHITFTDPPGAAFNFWTGVVSPGLGFYGPIAASTLGLSDVGSSYRELAGGIHIGDRYGMYEIAMTSHNRNIDINSPFGTINLNAFSGITISAPNGNVKIAGKNITLEAGNKIEIHSGQNVPPPAIGNPAGTATLVGYAASAGIGAAISAANEILMSSVIDFSLMRHVFEVFARPVDGTLLLKSRKYLKLEAGLGKATIQTDRFLDKYKDPRKLEDKQVFFKTVLDCVSHINTKVNGFFYDYNSRWIRAHEKGRAYIKRSLNLIKEFEDPDLVKMAYDLGSSGQEWTDDAVKLADYEGKFKDGEIQMDGKKLTTKEEKFEYVKTAAQEYLKACYEIYKLVYGFDDYMRLNGEGDFAWVKDQVGVYQDGDWIKTALDEWKDKYKDGNDLLAASLPTDEDPFRETNKNVFKRVMLLTFLHYMAAQPENKQSMRHDKWLAVDYDLNRLTNSKKAKYYLTTEFWWKHQIEHMDSLVQYDFWRNIFENSLVLFASNFKKNFRAFDKDIWDDKEGGQILFSDREDRTLEFTEENGLEAKKEANMYSLEHLKDVLKKFGDEE